MRESLSWGRNGFFLIGTPVAGKELGGSHDFDEHSGDELWNLRVEGFAATFGRVGKYFFGIEVSRLAPVGRLIVASLRSSDYRPYLIWGGCS